MIGNLSYGQTVKGKVPMNKTHKVIDSNKENRLIRSLILATKDWLITWVRVELDFVKEVDYYKTEYKGKTYIYDPNVGLDVFWDEHSLTIANNASLRVLCNAIKEQKPTSVKKVFIDLLLADFED